MRQSHPRLFESVMAVVLAATVVVLGCIYMRKSSGRFIATGARIGATWTVANWALDAPMFSGGPMQMTLREYAADIGIAYLMIPVITIGLGFAAAGAARRSTAEA